MAVCSGRLSSLGDRRLIVPINCFVPAFLVGAKTRVGVADRRAMLLAVGRRGRAGRASQGRARRGEPRTWRRGRRLDKMSGRPHAARAIGMEGLHFMICGMPAIISRQPAVLACEI